MDRRRCDAETPGGFQQRRQSRPLCDVARGDSAGTGTTPRGISERCVQPRTPRGRAGIRASRAIKRSRPTGDGRNRRPPVPPMDAAVASGRDPAAGGRYLIAPISEAIAGILRWARAPHLLLKAKSPAMLID